MIRRLLVLAALCALAACQSVQTTRPGVVGVDRTQQMLISSAEINASAEKAYQKEVGGAAKKSQVNRDAAQVARVRRIAQRLIPQTAAFRTDAPAWKWETNVITAKEVNAWCMPGGKIAVYTGLIDRLQPTDDELAAVMGHEIAHALREHGRERVSQAQAQGMLIGVIGAVAGLPQGTLDLTQIVVDLTFNLPNSREHEIEADRIGVELAARAGYDPRGAITLWEKMGKLGAAQSGGPSSAQSGGQPPEFLSTHPNHATRISDLRVYSAKVMPLYEAARLKP
jgi:predicted Zn-dependent protease